VIRGFFAGEDAQGLVEFALVLPVLLIVMVFGAVELGTVLSDAMTMSSASREGARVASALVNGGGALGCSAGQSPNAATVDPNVIAAVERVLVGNGTRIVLADVTEIRIAKATAAGAETAGAINTWRYLNNGGPVVDGQQLDFAAPGTGPSPAAQWQACSRNNVAPADSAVVTIVYVYRGRTPMRLLVPMFNSFTMTDRTVMAMNANR
jgi:Flp pilus assembly protein TadG